MHPITGEILQVIQDDILVDPELGSGAVKITPCHDLNDYECAVRHNLHGINIMDDDGYLNDNAKNCDLAGMNRYQARSKILKMLEEKGLLEGKDEHPMTLTRCSRSGDVLEPMLKPQWFVDCNNLAKRSVDMVSAEGSVENSIGIYPRKQKEEWDRWLNNIQDWCISRQLWWGHRIPAYRVVLNDNNSGTGYDKETDGIWIIARSMEDAKVIAAERYGISQEEVDLVQDEDVLDMVFFGTVSFVSSWLAIWWEGRSAIIHVMSTMEFQQVWLRIIRCL